LPKGKRGIAAETQIKEKKNTKEENRERCKQQEIVKKDENYT
jgi:hypothetical protein